MVILPYYPPQTLGEGNGPTTATAATVSTEEVHVVTVGRFRRPPRDLENWMTANNLSIAGGGGGVCCHVLRRLILLAEGILHNRMMICFIDASSRTYKRVRWTCGHRMRFFEYFVAI